MSNGTVNLFVPIEDVYPDLPAGILDAVPDDQGHSILDRVSLTDFSIEPGADQLVLRIDLAILGEVVLGIPGVDTLALVLGDATQPSVPFHLELVFAQKPKLRILDLEPKIRLPGSFFKPMTRSGSTAPFVPDPTRKPEIPLGAYDLEINPEAGITLSPRTGTSSSFQLSPVGLGDTGIVFEASGISVFLDPGAPPAGQPNGWRGCLVGNATIYLPPSISTSGGPVSVALTNASIGSSGISGTATASWNAGYNATTKTITGDLVGTLGGFIFALQSVSISLLNNALTNSSIVGLMQVPHFEQVLQVNVGLSTGGDLTLGVSANQPAMLNTSPCSSGLFSFDVPNTMHVCLQSLGLESSAGSFTIKLSGQITPLFDAPTLNWPGFQVKELSIDSKGNVHLQGGWLNLPKQYHLNFYGFTMEIEKLGFGNTSDGGKWIGFSGGITLVDGMPAGASVDGLRLTWYEDGRAPQISLNGVGIAFSVPDVLDFEGTVSYDSSLKKFHGSLTLDLISLDMEVDGKAVFGVQQGQTYFALYLAAEWPAGIPLWATGLGLYGIAGLFALSMEPNKGASDEWYGLDPSHSWYLRNPAGVIDLDKKWMEQAGAMALGAGATLGTVSDNGHAFSGRMLLVIVFPGPVLLIEGKASLLQDRARLDKDANFRALAVLDANAGTFSVGLDARYQYDGSGKLINIHGGAEAFFNFNDASAWYLYLGEKDQNKRIQARIFQLFEADCYVMLDAHKLAMGAWIGYNNQWTFGPLSVTLQAWLDSNAVVNWHPVHFHGDLWLHGSVALSAFGIGLGLTVDARLAADVFDPFHILGQFSVSLSLPWPLPSPSASVTLEWGPNPTAPTLPKPLLEVAVEHFKTTTSWPLPDGALLLPAAVAPPTHDQIPVIPLDSRPHVTFSRPVNDDALVGVNAQPLVPDWERVGDPSQNQGPVKVRYGLSQVVLEKQDGGGGWPAVAQTPAVSGLPKLYGSWAPLPHMPDGGGQNHGQTKLWLWSKSAFDYTRHTGGTWNEWFTDRYSSYPCGPLVQTCWDFEQVTPIAQLPNPWPYPANPGLVFSCGATDNMSITTLSQPVEGLTHALCLSGPLNATIMLPEPRNVVKIPVLDSYPSYTAFYGYDAQGNAYGPFTRSSSEQTTVEIRGGNMTRIGITTPLSLASGVSGAIGCAYVAQRNQLLFVEFGGGGVGAGKLSAIDLNTNSYSVLGTGYTAPEDIVVTADGKTAYVTERPGNLLRLDLTKQRLNRSAATMVSTGMTAPQQIALDEARNTAYVVEYANPGNLLRIDLGSGYAAPMYGSLNNAVGLLLVPGSSTVYISEQGGNGQLSRVTFNAGEDTTRDVLFSGLTNPFFMRWGNTEHTQILLPLRDPANRLVMLDLSQSPVSMTGMADGVPFRPSSLALLPGHRLAVCSDGAVSGYATQLCIPQVCAVTADELIQHFEDELDRWSQAGEVLEPYTTYRLQVTTTVHAEGEGAMMSWYRPPTQTYTDCAYFRTGAPPTLETLSTPVGYPGTAGPFQSGLDDLGRYVSQAAATPVAGTPGAYALGIEFNENYVDLLYALARRDLVIHLYDNNGPARAANGRLITLGNEWGRVDQLTLTESEISWLAVLSQNGCAFIDPQVILRNRKLLSPIESQVLAPQSLYEARLVPMLLHEDFSGGSFTNPLGTWSAQDTAGTSQWHTSRDGTPPAPFVVQTTTATSTLLWTPNQRGDWADYRLNVHLRAATNAPIGIVFRYQNPGQFYRFSLEPQSPYWQLVRQDSTGTTTYPLFPSSAGKAFQTGVDYLITIEAVHKAINIYQKAINIDPNDTLLFTVSEQNATSGTIGLYCANHPGARFSDVRVEDFRATAPVAYRFTFTTS